MSVLAKRTAEQLNLLREMDGAYESDFDRKWHTIGEMDLFVEQELIAEGEWPPPGIKWYYSDKSVCIAHGDCREILPLLPKVDLVLTDPPYGIGYKPLRGSNGSKMWGFETITGDDVDFDPSFLMSRGNLILWGANHYAHKLPPSRGWLVWDKVGEKPRQGFIYSHFEMAWTNIVTRAMKFVWEWQGASRHGEDFLHPTQKPVELMAWCIEKAGDCETILDPFMGSGTTLRAAKDLGRKAIGIEIEKKYCEIAAKRMSQEVLEFEPA